MNVNYRTHFVSPTAVRWGALVLAVTLLQVRVQGQSVDSGSGDGVDLRELSFEELLDIQVTSVSRKKESVTRSAAAIAVVTQEDIRRTGATNLPEAIRLAPGMQVASIDSANWAISSRGFNDLYSNKLLVMIDGRPIYTPLFSGVFWDANDTFMDDIDRIEIVRGPGATLWGANAVNGVINVISKSAKETQGVLTYGALGTELLGGGGARYGFQLGDDVFVRVYGQYSERDSFALADGSDASDRYELGQGGFRLDWEPNAQNELTFQGDIYGGSSRYLADSFPAAPPYVGRILRSPNIGGGNLLGRWRHYFAEDAPLTVQVFFDRTERDNDFQRERRSTFDIDVQQQFALGERGEVVIGGNYRSSEDHLLGPQGLAVLPTTDGIRPIDERLDFGGGFVQAGWDLIEDELNFTIGSKVGHNDFTGVEVQPSARVRWHPSEGETLWGAVSRAVRTPSRSERGLQFTQFVPDIGGAVSFQGNDRYEAENLTAFELGYRRQSNERFWWDIAGFYNAYDDLQTREFAFPLFGGGLPVLPLSAANLMEGDSYGAELSLNWRLADWWRIRPSYSYLQIETDLASSSTDISSAAVEGTSPRHSASLWSFMDFPGGFEVDTGLRYVDSLPSLGISSYLVADIRLGYRVNDSVTVSLGAKNVFDDRHPEFAPVFFFLESVEVQHSLYAKVVVTF